MQNIMQKLFEAGLLSEEDQSSLQEAFEARITEATQLAEQQVREEMATRYDADKANLVEAMDRMLTDVVQKYESQKVSESQQLREAKEKLKEQAGSLSKQYRTKIKEHAKVLETFVVNTLTKEVGELSEDAKAISEMRVKYAKALAECDTKYKQRMAEQIKVLKSFVVEKLDEEITNVLVQSKKLQERKEQLVKENAQYRKSLKEQAQTRITKMDKFVVSRVAEELREFQEDRQELVKKKVQLVSEARAKLAETQRTFVKQAAQIVDRKITETMKTELSQLHEDLERNRQNMFGRKVFEAIASEYMNSYFAEGTEVKKLEKILEAKEAELAKAKATLVESKQATDAASRKAKLAEEAAHRTKIMSELLSPLGKEKRVVMQELLESVKTPALRDAFDKYLPAVLNENQKKKTPQGRQALNEGAEKGKSTVAVTGDQRINRLQAVKAQNSENEVSPETATILKLAGIKK